MQFNSVNSDDAKPSKDVVQVFVWRTGVQRLAGMTRIVVVGR